MKLSFDHLNPMLKWNAPYNSPCHYNFSTSISGRHQVNKKMSTLASLFCFCVPSSSFIPEKQQEVGQPWGDKAMGR